jgi:hypothetical protein
VQAISIAADGAVALRTDGSVAEWGWFFGTLEPFPAVPASLSSAVVSVAAGNNYALAAKADGTVVGWGLNSAQALQGMPAGLAGVKQVAAGLNFAVALKTDGTLVAWGNNTNGTATPPAGLSGVVSIAAGEHYAMALRSDGSVVTWGYTNSDGAAPTPATLGSQVYTIAAGYYNGMAIRATSPTISGSPTPAVLGQAYDYALTVGGSPAPTVRLVGGRLPVGLSVTGDGHIVGTPTQTGRFQVSIFATSTAGSAGVNVTVTVDPAHSTNVEFLDQAPASVVDGALESDQYVRSFAEQYNKVLAGDLTVGGSTVPAGTRVNVYYLHADHVGSPEPGHEVRRLRVVRRQGPGHRDQHGRPAEHHRPARGAGDGLLHPGRPGAGVRRLGDPVGRPGRRQLLPQELERRRRRPHHHPRPLTSARWGGPIRSAPSVRVDT